MKSNAIMKHFLFRVCEGTRQPEEVLREQIDKYKEVFERSVAQARFEIIRFVISIPNGQFAESQILILTFSLELGK